MAVHYDIFQLYKEYFSNVELKYAELGAQYVCGGPWGGYGPPYFRELFKTIDITSFDINGENGSHKLNLSVPLSSQTEFTQFTNCFDVITNFGTTEHVQNQYVCWKNIFDLLRENGIIISDVPKVDNWPNHCKFYYDKNFFECLNQDFEIIEYKDFSISTNLTSCTNVLRKKHSGQFQTSWETLYKNLTVIENYIDTQGA